MFCNDPYISLLKSQGYNVVRLPREHFSPLILLSQEEGKDLSRMGSISELLVDAEPPIVNVNETAATLSGKSTGNINIGIGVNILGTIIDAMGGSQIGLDTKFRRARYAAFEFTDVLADDVSIVELDKYLCRARIDPGSRYLRQLLETDELYVVTGTVKSKKFTIETKIDGQASVSLQVPEIQQIVGASIKVSHAAESASKVTFEGLVPLTFGFQAHRLIYEGGDYVKLQLVPAGSVASKDVDDVLAGQFEKETKMMLGKGAFVRVL